MQPAFIIKPLPKVRSLPTFIHATKQSLSPKTVKKEIAFGAAMAFASVYMAGNHHHHITYGELEQTMATEAVNFISTINSEKRDLIEKVKKSKKYKLFTYILFCVIAAQISAIILRLFVFQFISSLL